MECRKLDLDSVEVNGTREPVASYKSLSEDDVNRQNNPNQEKMATDERSGESEVDDEVQERMIKDNSKIGINRDTTEVKFSSENGDAKIDMETVKQTLAGMGKEELMKFANDPFWIRLRWFLFIAFWLLWIGMLAGAIAIIVMAPKCSAPQPRKWWEESPIVQLDASDAPTKDLKGLESLLENLEAQHIKTISLTPIVKAKMLGHTEDFKDIQPKLGRMSDLEAFIKAARKRDQRVVLELDPNHSSLEHPWFKRSVKREEPYTGYYVWADRKPGTDSKLNPPNNWLSVNGGSAWEWNTERGQFYLHQFKKTQPDLNYNNPKVISEFGDILTHWLQLGISGFRLANSQYLTEDSSLRDEAPSTNPANAEDYQSLVHVYTRDRPENGAVLRQWREIVSNHTNGEGLFALRDDIGADILEVFNENKTLIDLPQNSQFLSTADSNISAAVLNKSISQWLSSSTWPGWDLNGENVGLRQRVPREVANSLTLMMLLLPGTPILRLNDTLLARDAFVTLTKARSTFAFLYGDTTTGTINGTVFAYARFRSGNPGYLVAYQSGEKSISIDLSTLPQIPDEVNVLAYSPNYIQDGGTIRTKLSSKQVPISAKSTVILTFVPKG